MSREIPPFGELDARDDWATSMHPESYPALTLVSNEGGNGFPVVSLSIPAFDALPEYSTTVPSGVFHRKVWKRNRAITDKSQPNPSWVLGTYLNSVSNPENCETWWFEIQEAEACYR